MGKPTSGIRCCDGRNGFSNGLLEGLQRSRRLRPQQRFDCRPTCLDRGQVWRIGRKIEQASSRRRNCLCDAGHFVDFEIIHDDHLPWAELRDQHLAEKGQKDVAIGEAFDGHGGHDPVKPQGTKHRDVPAPIDGLRRMGALAAGGACIIACQGLMAPGLIKKDQGVGGHLLQGVEKVKALLWDVRSLLLDGAERFFCEAS